MIPVLTATGSFALQNYYEYLLVTEIQGGEQYLLERKIMAHNKKYERYRKYALTWFFIKHPEN